MTEKPSIHRLVSSKKESALDKLLLPVFEEASRSFNHYYHATTEALLRIISAGNVGRTYLTLRHSHRWERRAIINLIGCCCILQLSYVDGPVHYPPSSRPSVRPSVAGNFYTWETKARKEKEAGEAVWSPDPKHFRSFDGCLRRRRRAVQKV